MAVYTLIRKGIEKKIKSEYPGLPAGEINKVTNSQFQKFIKKNNKRIEKTVREAASNPAGKKIPLYLLGSDSYYYLSLTRQLVNSCKYSSEFKDGRYLNKLMLAPYGAWRKIEAHPYSGFLLYKAIHLLNKNLSLIETAAAVPLILFFLALWLFIYLCRLFNIPKTLTFISGVFFSLSPIFIQRSSLGWYDTDPYNVIFPLLTLAMLFKISKTNRILPTIMLGIICSIYSLFWQGWLWLAGFSLISLLSIYIYRLISLRKKASLSSKNCLIFIFVWLILSTMILTPKGLWDSITNVTGIISRYTLTKLNNWPDIFITVGELKKPSFAKIVHLLGGYIFIIISFLGITRVFLSKKNKEKKEKYIPLLILYTACFITAGKAERFAILLITPVSFSFALGLNFITEKFSAVTKKLYKRPSLGNYLGKGLSLLLIASPLIYGHASSLNQNPVFNRIWDKSLSEINQLTPENSIVNTWWPPGHFIKAVSKRRVIFDGATLEVPQSYWMARALMSDSEKEGLNILRMLDSSANKCVEFLLNKNIPLPESIDIINKLLTTDKSKWTAVLKGHLDKRKARELLSLFQKKPLPACMMIYNEMAEDALGFYFVKNWNFKRFVQITSDKTILKKRPKILDRGTKDNIAFLWAVSGGPVYVGKQSFKTAEAEDKMYFSNGVMLDTSTMEAETASFDKRISGRPKSILYMDRNNLLAKNYDNPDNSLSILFIPGRKGRINSCIISSEDILSSILFRLYYLEGRGLNHFKKIIEEEAPLLNTKIVVYKINWD